MINKTYKERRVCKESHLDLRHIIEKEDHYYHQESSHEKEEVEHILQDVVAVHVFV